MIFVSKENKDSEERKYTSFYRHVARFYEEKFRGSDKAQMEIEELTKILKKGNVLDAGCGTGRHSVYLAMHGFDVTGIDISLDMLNEAEKKTRNLDEKIKFLHSDICSTTFPDKCFDNIICMYSVFSELTANDQTLCMEEFNRILKDDGVLVIEVPNRIVFESLGSRLKALGFEQIDGLGNFKLHVSINGKNYDLRTHLFSAHEIESIVKENGFKIDSLFGENFTSFSSNTSKNIILVCRKF